jgi:hypothetical protein
MKMPFGRFRGTSLTSLPDYYVLWLLMLPDLQDPLLTEINAEADRRNADARAGVVAAESGRGL